DGGLPAHAKDPEHHGARLGRGHGGGGDGGRRTVDLAVGALDRGGGVHSRVGDDAARGGVLAGERPLVARRLRGPGYTDVAGGAAIPPDEGPTGRSGHRGLVQDVEARDQPVSQLYSGG